MDPHNLAPCCLGQPAMESRQELQTFLTQSLTHPYLLCHISHKLKHDGNPFFIYHSEKLLAGPVFLVFLPPFVGGVRLQASSRDTIQNENEKISKVDIFLSTLILSCWLSI